MELDFVLAASGRGMRLGMFIALLSKYGIWPLVAAFGGWVALASTIDFVQNRKAAKLGEDKTP